MRIVVTGSLLLLILGCTHSNKNTDATRMRLINQGRFRLNISITKDGDTSEIGTLRKIDKVFLPKQ